MPADPRNHGRDDELSIDDDDDDETMPLPLWWKTCQACHGSGLDRLGADCLTCYGDGTVDLD